MPEERFHGTSPPRYLNTALSAHRGASGRERWTLGAHDVHADLSEYSPGDLSLRGVREGGNGLLRLLPRRPPPSRRPDASARRRDLRELPAPGLPRVRACGVPLRRLLPGVPVYGGGGMFTSWRSSLRGMDRSFLPFDRVGFGPGGARPRRGGPGRVVGRRRLFRGRGSGGVPPRFRVRAAPGVSVPGAGPPGHRDAGVLLEEMPVLPRGGRPHPSVPGDGPGDVPHASAGVVRSVRRPAVSPDGQRDPGRHPPVDGGRGERAARPFVARVRPLRAGTARTGVRRLAGRGGCSMLQLGLESGSQPLLDRMGKGPASPTPRRSCRTSPARGSPPTST